ncbi:hypothetical protein WJX82_006755 [Trebouxia sp. C0006]
MSDLLSDPDTFARSVVQQYLHEHGMHSALQAMEKQQGRKFVPGSMPTGSMLLELVYKHLEEQAAADDSGETDLAAEEEALLHGGNQDYPHQLTHAVDNLHESSVISICCWPGDNSRAVTGSGNGLVQLLDYARDEFEWRYHSNAGGILSLALQPTAEQSKMLLLAGSMDGSVTLLDAHTGTVLTRHKAHAKYCVRVRWSPDSSHCVSCSWDHTMAVLTHSTSTDEPSLQLQKSTTYLSQVQDVEFIPGAEPSDQLLAVALKNTNYLRLFDVHELKEHSKVNMNAMGDDHVSFSASHLAVSPCQRYLLVSTDGSRIIMFRLKDWTQTRNFYGLSVEEKFHQPCAAWHKSSFYIFAAAAAGHVYVFHVGTTKVEAQLKAHLKNVRALDYNAETNTLVTCSFDKAVKVFT